MLRSTPPRRHTRRRLWNLAPGDYEAALGVFLMVVIATFPVVNPFLRSSDAALETRLSRIVTLVMMFVAGFALGRHSGDARTLVAGLTMSVVGVVLIAAAMAPGGGGLRSPRLLEAGGSTCPPKSN